jgi:hypothetical protein
MRTPNTISRRMTAVIALTTVLAGMGIVSHASADATTETRPRAAAEAQPGVATDTRPGAAARPQADLPVLGHFRNGHQDESGLWGDRMKKAEELYGPFTGRWRNYHPPGSRGPLNNKATGEAERAALRAGKKLHLSWRPYDEGENWAHAASGRHDTKIRQVLRRMQNECGEQCPGIWLSIAHEPELDWAEHCPSVNPCPGYTYANFKKMWDRVVEARKAVSADKVKLVWVVQGNETHQRHYDNLWPGNNKVDIVGQDPYIGKNTPYERLAEHMIKRTEWFVKESKKGNGVHDYASKPHIFAEYGCDLGGSEGDRGKPQHRAHCIDEVSKRLPEITDIPGIDIVEMAFFDAGSSRIESDPSSLDHQAYKRLKAATQP